MFLKAVKGRCLNSRTPNMSTEGPQSGQFVCQYEFLCQYEFQLSLSFSRQNKELEKKVHEIRVF